MHMCTSLSLSLIGSLSQNQSPRNLSYNVNSRPHCRCLCTCTSTALCTSHGTVPCPNGCHNWFVAFFVDTCLCGQPRHTRVHLGVSPDPCPKEDSFDILFVAWVLWRLPENNVVERELLFLSGSLVQTHQRDPDHFDAVSPSPPAMQPRLGPQR